MKPVKLARSLALLAGALVVSQSMAAVMESAFFGGVDPAASPVILTRVFTVTGYTLGRIDWSALVSQSDLYDTPSEYRIDMTTPGYGLTSFYIWPNSGQVTAPLWPVVHTYTRTGFLYLNAGLVAPFGNQPWTFAFEEEGSGNSNTTMSVTVNLTNEIATPPTVVQQWSPLPASVTHFATYTAGQVRWYKFNITAPANLTQALDIDTETSTASTSTAIAIWSQYGNLLASDESDGSGLLSQLSFGGQLNHRPPYTTASNPYSSAYNGRDGNLPVGTYYVSVTRTGASYGTPFQVTSTSTGPASITLRAALTPTSGALLPVNLGTLGLTMVSPAFLPLNSNEVKWFKFTVPVGTSATRFLDIDTETSTTATASTTIALWDSTGNFLVSDETDGSGNLSQLTWGGFVNPRPSFTTGTNSPSLLYDGRNGNLPAGTYFLSLTQAPANYQNPWRVWGFGTATANLKVRINYGTATGVPAPVDLGSLALGTTSQTFNVAPYEVKWFKFNLNTATSLTRFLDVDMNTSTANYDFALFNDTGTPLFFDDGWGAQTVPSFSFGGQYNPRAALPTTQVFSGQCGTLNPGTYYLAVGQGPLSVGNTFAASTPSIATASNVPLRFRLGDVTLPSNIRLALPVSGVSKVGSPNIGQSSLAGLFDGLNRDRRVAQMFTITDPNGWTINTVEGTFVHSVDASMPVSQTVHIIPRQQFGTLPVPVPIATYSNLTTWTSVDAGAYSSSQRLRRYIITIPPTTLGPGDYFLMIQPSTSMNSDIQWLQFAPDTVYSGGAAFRRGQNSQFGADPSMPTSWTAISRQLAMRIDGTVNPGFTGTLDLGQLGGTPYNSGANLPTSISVSYRNAANNEIAVGTASYNPVTGAVSGVIPAAVTGPYRVSIKIGNWLRITRPNPNDPAAPFGNYNFGTAAPLVGDADDDNAITPSDYGIWQIQNGSFPAENTGADFDGDGAVTASDYGLWQVNNGALGDD